MLTLYVDESDRIIATFADISRQSSHSLATALLTLVQSFFPLSSSQT